MNYNHLIDNADKLLSAALIKGLVGSPIPWALLPECFMNPSICDPCIPWWHHAQCGSLHMARHASALASDIGEFVSTYLAENLTCIFWVAI